MRKLESLNDEELKFLMNGLSQTVSHVFRIFNMEEPKFSLIIFTDNIDRHISNCSCEDIKKLEGKRL